MSDIPRTTTSLKTPLGWLSDNRTPQVRKPLIDPARTAASRRKGGMNLKAVAEVLRERGYDPTVELLKLLEGDKLDADVKARMLTTLMEYVHPKKKSVEITGAEGGPIQIDHVSDAMLIQIATQATEVIEEDEVPESPFRESASKDFGE